MLGLEAPNANYSMCTVRRPDPPLEDQEKRKRFIIDIACPNETNKTEKIRKY
jgi:hypothetical protein